MIPQRRIQLGINDAMDILATNRRSKIISRVGVARFD